MRQRNYEGADEALFELFMVLPIWAPPIVAGAVWLLAWRLLPSAGAQLGAGGAVVVLLIGLAARMDSRRRRRLAEAQRSLDDLKALHWTEFEELVGEAYRREGFTVQATAGGADGGVDLILHRAGKVTLVQCKQWKQRQIGVRTVRELLGVVTSEHATSGIVVGSGRFTAEAEAFARRSRISLVDGNALLTLLGREGPSSSVAPTSVANPGEVLPGIAAEAISRPVGPSVKPLTKVRSLLPPPTSCPECGNGMVLRTSRYGAFYGCRSYPACRGTRPASRPAGAKDPAPN